MFDVAKLTHHYWDNNTQKGNKLIIIEILPFWVINQILHFSIKILVLYDQKEGFFY